MNYSFENLKYYAQHGNMIQVDSKVIHVNQKKYSGVYIVKSIRPGNSNNAEHPGILGVEIAGLEIEDQSKLHSGIPLHSLRLID
jgi:hypothetical protein